MKKKKINADAALLEVARRHHTTVEEVRKEIRLAIIPVIRSRRKISLHTLQSSACHNDLTLWS